MLRTVNFKSNTYVIGGHILGGFAEGGDAVNFEPAADVAAMESGADGEVTRVINNNESWICTIRLQQSSPSNDFLSGLSQSKAVVPFLGKDGTGTSTWAEAQAFVMANPSAASGSEVGEREWKIALPKPTWNVGGNT